MSDPLKPDAALMDMLYTAALGDAGWDEPLRRMVALTEMRFGALFNLNAVTGEPSMQALVGEEANSASDFLRQYVGEFHAYDPTPDLVAQWPAGRWFIDTQVLAPQERQRGVYYNEFLQPLGAANWAGMFVNRGTQSGFLSFIGAPGQILDAQRQAHIDAVRDHVARALQVSRRLAVLERQSGLYLAALDGIDSPVFLLDENGTLLLDNAAARALAAAQPLALHFRHKRFAPPVAGWDVAHWRNACVSGALKLRCIDGTPLHLLITPVPPHAQLAQHWQRPLVLMSAAGNITHAERAKRLRALYGLSPAESELAVMLACGGLSPQECADARKVAEDTVRTQIKSIQAKLSARRLPLLVAKVLSL